MRRAAIAGSIALAACGRIEFSSASDASVGTADGSDAGGPIIVDCATATFANPAASSIVANFSGGQPAGWFATAGCANISGGEIRAAPESNVANSYCSIGTPTVHLTCSTFTLKVLETTIEQLGAQTTVYVVGSTFNAAELFTELGGFSFNEIDRGPFDLANDAWWRIEETGGELVFSTGADGTSFTERGRAPTLLSADDVNILIGAGDYLAISSPGQARFDCVNTGPGC